MVPCPWARAAASSYLGEDVGVHLTLTAEFELYRWGPVTYGPSLLGGQGGFPGTVEDAWDHADLDETRRELRAQIERAILWGFDVTHLDCHMGVLMLRPEFFDIYLDLAVDFALPLRLSGRSTQDAVGFPFRDLADAEGIVVPDHLVVYPGVGARRPFERALMDLRPGRHRGLPASRDRPQRAPCVRPGLGRPGRRSSRADPRLAVLGHGLTIGRPPDRLARAPGAAADGLRTGHPLGFRPGDRRGDDGVSSAQCACRALLSAGPRGREDRRDRPTRRRCRLTGPR